MERDLKINRRRGVAIWYSIVLMMAVCALMSFVVDLGRAQLVKTEMRRAADAAARAAAAEITERHGCRSLAGSCGLPP